MRAVTRRRLTKHWGYILLGVVCLCWFEGGAPPVALGLMSLAVVFYCLFQAPVPCCAHTREKKFCRHNAAGLLRGCYLEAHRWQNMRTLISSQTWTQFARGVFRKTGGKAAALTAIAGSVSAIAAVVNIALQ